MKKLKSIIALCLIVCICLSSMVMFASAAEKSVNWTAVCQTDGVNFRRSPNTDNDADIIANFLEGDTMNVENGVNAAWYYGTPGVGSAPYLLFHGVHGYSASLFFHLY